jgi:predicted dehydrogenase/FAD/FMN-containing dehydrogenase
MRDLIFITCTYRRPQRLAFFRRHIERLISKIDRYIWIVVEDGNGLDPELQTLLQGCNNIYLHIGPSDDSGSSQRNLALDYIRDKRLDGIVYNLEEENLVHAELAAEIRRISRLGIFPVGNLGPNGIERPVIKDQKFTGWDCGWAERKFPVSMGGFAFDARLIFDAVSPIWDWHGPAGESEFIAKLINYVAEVDFSPCQWNQSCLVFHKEPLVKAPAVPVNQNTGPKIQIQRDLPYASDYGLATNRRTRLALVGCGWFATEAHIPALQKLEQDGLVEVAGICSRSDESLARAARQFGARPLKRYNKIEAVLQDADIDLVDLVLPIGVMPAALRAALRAGKHVISEKPGAPSVAACVELMQCQGGVDKTPFWAVAENWRFKNTVRVIADIVKNGRIGALYLANFQFISSSSEQFYKGWRGAPDYAGGHILDSGVHFIAMLRHVVGEIARVSATTSQRLAHLPPVDTVTAAMTFVDGAEGAFQLSFAAAPQDGTPPVLTLIGAHGSLQADFFSNVIRLRAGGPEQVFKVPDDPWVQGGVYQNLAHCLNALRYDAPLRSSPADAMRDVAVIEAILQSGESGQAVTVASLYPALHQPARNIATYNGIFSFEPKYIAECHSIADVSAVVTQAVSHGLRIRPMGVGNSWAPELLTRDVCLTTQGLNRIKKIDPARQTVCAEAGVRVGDLTRALAAHGLSLPSLPFNPNVTLGGAVASATHGTSLKWGTLSDSVVALKIVSAAGEVVPLGPDSPPDELRAARVSLGMLGVIVEMELEIIPMPWIRFFAQRMEMSAFLAQREEIFARADHVWGHWTLGTDQITIECLETRAAPEAGFYPYVTGETGSWAALRQPAPAAAWTVTKGNRAQVWMSMQYAVALSQIEIAIDLIRGSAFAARHHGLIIELKFLQGSDRSLLGPNAGQDSVLFNMFWRVDDVLKADLFNDFEDTMRGMAARPHWGKAHRALDKGYVKQAYPQWDIFESVRSGFDPAGVFSIF